MLFPYFNIPKKISEKTILEITENNQFAVRKSFLTLLLNEIDLRSFRQASNSCKLPVNFHNTKTRKGLELLN